MIIPDLHNEKILWNKGSLYVAGIDEVGRGAFAGPVVAGCVVFQSFFCYKTNDIVIRDSKKLSKKQRDFADRWIKNNAMTWGVGKVSAKKIDKIGIVKATQKAMREAVGNANKRFQKKIDFLLIDAFYLPNTRGLRAPIKKYRSKKALTKLHTQYALKGDRQLMQNRSKCGFQLAIVKGDETCFSIASASIIAKVYRDSLMSDLGSKKRYKKYGWDKNKGYGTEKHQKSIALWGVSNKYHRRTFLGS